MSDETVFCCAAPCQAQGHERCARPGFASCTRGDAWSSGHTASGVSALILWKSLCSNIQAVQACAQLSAGSAVELRFISTSVSRERSAESNAATRDAMVTRCILSLYQAIQSCNVRLTRDKLCSASVRSHARQSSATTVRAGTALCSEFTSVQPRSRQSTTCVLNANSGDLTPSAWIGDTELQSHDLLAVQREDAAHAFYTRDPATRKQGDIGHLTAVQLLDEAAEAYLMARPMERDCRHGKRVDCK